MNFHQFILKLKSEIEFQTTINVLCMQCTFCKLEFKHVQFQNVLKCWIWEFGYYKFCFIFQEFTAFWTEKLIRLMRKLFNYLLVSARLILSPTRFNKSLVRAYVGIGRNLPILLIFLQRIFLQIKSRDL